MMMTSPFHCALIVVDKFDVDRETAAQFLWQQNNAHRLH